METKRPSEIRPGCEARLYAKDPDEVSWRYSVRVPTQKLVKRNVVQLPPEFVNNASPEILHRMYWTMEERIGELPKEWNHLVGEYKENPNAHNVHWTIGGPYFNEYSGVEFSDEWRKVKEDTLHCQQLEIPALKKG